MRRYLLLALPMLVSGCAVPPAIVVASYTADGLSYLATGKSLEDHGLSAATNEDCALHRVLIEESVCSDFKLADVNASVASARPKSTAAQKDPQGAPGTIPAAMPVPSTRPTEFVVQPPVPQNRQTAARAPVSPRDPASAPGPRAASPANDVGSRRYLVLGSFSEREHAVRFAREMGEPKLAIVAAQSGGRTVYRVIAGPLTVTRVVRLRADLAGKVPGSPWELASLPGD